MHKSDFNKEKFIYTSILDGILLCTLYMLSTEIYTLVHSHTLFCKMAIIGKFQFILSLSALCSDRGWECIRTIQLCQGLRDCERLLPRCVCVLVIFMQLSQPTETIAKSNDDSMAYGVKCQYKMPWGLMEIGGTDRFSK